VLFDERQKTNRFGIFRLSSSVEISRSIKSIGGQKMQYRKLGNTGIDVSVMALGCWPFAGGKVWGEQSDDDSIATVHAALDAGINFFDTAEGYEAGQSERVLGRGLLGRRHEAVIASKVSAAHLAAGGCDGRLRGEPAQFADRLY
jgi:diketogulonate reductase-like aldo/keto reductase